MHAPKMSWSYYGQIMNWSYRWQHIGHMVVTYRFGHIHATKLLVIRAGNMLHSGSYGWSYGNINFFNSSVMIVWSYFYDHIMATSWPIHRCHIVVIWAIQPKCDQIFDCSDARHIVSLLLSIEDFGYHVRVIVTSFAMCGQQLAAGNSLTDGMLAYGIAFLL